MRKALMLGMASSVFFSFTFVINRQMNVTGGSWIWSASLRFLFMFPILLLLVAARRELAPVLRDIRLHPGRWFLWSTVGFGLFYTPLSAASVFGPSWLIAGTWQLTTITGALLSPLFFHEEWVDGRSIRARNRIPRTPLLFGAVILCGIALMQFQEATEISVSSAAASTLLVLSAAVFYPLGNRKMMELCGDRLNTIQRVFGMTLCSLPYWAAVSLWGGVSHGLPGGLQLAQAFLVALFAGVVATLLYFHATNLVRHHPQQLAVVESTVSLQVVFVLLGSVFLFHDKAPSALSLAGLALVVVGMVFNSLFANRS